MTRQYHKHQCALSLKFYKMLTLGLVFRFSHTASQIQSAFCEPLLIPASLPGKKVKVVQSWAKAPMVGGGAGFVV